MGFSEIAKTYDILQQSKQLNTPTGELQMKLHNPFTSQDDNVCASAIITIVILIMSVTAFFVAKVGFVAILILVLLILALLILFVLLTPIFVAIRYIFTGK